MLRTFNLDLHDLPKNQSNIYRSNLLALKRGAPFFTTTPWCVAGYETDKQMIRPSGKAAKKLADPERSEDPLWVEAL